MKLNLFFVIMDILTILAYPIIYVHGKLRQFLKLKESVAPYKVLVTAGR
jgi:hypothetical protein